MNNIINIGTERNIKVDVDLTAENLQTYVIDKKMKVVSYVEKQICDKAFITELYANPLKQINLFEGAIEITLDEATQLVPITFDKSDKPKMFDEVVQDEVIDDDGNLITIDINVKAAHVDENNNVIMEQMNWIEYCGFFNKVKFLNESINGKLLLNIGSRTNLGSGHQVFNDEFRMFADYWGIERVLTRSERDSIDQRKAIIKFRASLVDKDIYSMDEDEMNILLSELRIATGLNFDLVDLILEDKLNLFKDKIGLWF